MQMNHNQSAQVVALLTKYREGKCTPEEAQQVENWLHNLGENSLDAKQHTEDIFLKTARKQVLIDTAPQRSIYANMLTYARIAAVTLLIPLAYLLYVNNSKPHAVTGQQFKTLAGENKIIRLPDSTEVVLNASSVLTIGANFNEKFRNVKLSGEAYFRVAHDTTKPFIVSTGKLQTRVLGTEFNVHAYNNEGSI